MSELRSGIAEVNGAHLYYEVAGTGPALVLIHGFSGDCRSWDDQFAASTKTFRVIRYDLRGYGRSGLPTSQAYSHTSDLEALLIHLGISKTHVAGISMGGSIATHFALTRPAFVRALILISPGLIGWEWSPEWKSLWSDVIARGQREGVEAAKQLWINHPLFAPARRKADTAARVSKMVSDYSGWHWIHPDPLQYSGPVDMERLNEIEAPTLIVTGERDLPDFHMIAEILRDNISGARAITLSDSGHLLTLEAPFELNRAVSEFLAPLPT